MRYLFHLSFKGTRYYGWQRQPKLQTVQESIESTLRNITGKKVSIHGCGRTDAGVHASQFFFHTGLEINDHGSFLYILNQNLPADIAVFDCHEIPSDFNAQFKAIERTYHYFLHTTKQNNKIYKLKY